MRTPAVIVTVILLVMTGLLAVLVCGVMPFDEGRPLQIELHYPTPYPTAVIPPTATPIPTAPPSGAVLVRLAEKYDSITNQADRQYQRVDGDTTDRNIAFTETDFIGHGAVGSVGNVIMLPQCIPFSDPNLDPRYIFPWTRYAIAIPTAQSIPDHILAAGFDVRDAFVLQEYRTTAGDPSTQVNTVLDIGGNDYHILVSRDRLDCRLNEGSTWSLHN